MFRLMYLVCMCLYVLAPARAAAQEDSFTFGICLSISGEFQESGRKALAGVKLRVDDYNDNIPPGMPRLQYAILDDKSDPKTAKENMTLFAQEGFQAVVGPLSTLLVMGMREVAEKEHMVIISPTVTSSKVGKNRDWVCRLLFDDEFQGTALARFLVGRKEITRAAAIINDRFAYASAVFNSFKAEFEKLGGSIVGTEHYEWVADELKAYDFTKALKNIDAANPEIVLLPVNSVEVAAIIGQSTRLGMNLKFCGGDTWQHELVRVASGNNVEDAYFVSGLNLDSDSPAMRHYNYLYDHSNDPDIQATSVMGYDAASLLIEAVKNGTDAESIRDGLYSIKDFELATGTITIDPERGSEKSAFISRMEKEGERFVPVVVDEMKP